MPNAAILTSIIDKDFLPEKHVLKDPKQAKIASSNPGSGDINNLFAYPLFTLFYDVARKFFELAE
ncbi:MAG: hypothetical protein M1485_05220 [Chloroflexi bacterium]|nr:hypothetical protein [Chloroflexota bacterium]